MPDAPGLAYTPAFSPDGRFIAYSRYKPGGFRDVHIYELATSTDRAIAVDRAMDMDPRFTPDGRFVVFASDRTGIANIFAYELATKRLYQVTNVLSGAYQPAISPDGRRLVFTGFTSDGFDLWTMPFDPATFQPAQPFANARLDAPEDLDAETDSPDARPEDAAAVPFATRTIPYRAWKYLYPRQWQFTVLQDAFGLGNTLQVQTSLADPVGHASVRFELVVPQRRAPGLAGQLRVQPALAHPDRHRRRVGHAVARPHRGRPESGLPAAHLQPLGGRRLARDAPGGCVRRRLAGVRLLRLRAWSGRCRSAIPRGRSPSNRPAAHSRTCASGGRSRTPTAGRTRSAIRPAATCR